MKDVAAVLAIVLGLIVGFLAFSVVAFGAWQVLGHPPHPAPGGGMGPLVGGGCCMGANLILVAAGVGYFIQRRRRAAS